MDSIDSKNIITEITKDLLQRVGFEGEVKLIENSQSGESKFFTVSVESEQDLSMLIGKNGQNLNAFDHLVRLMVFRKLANTENKETANFIVDINDYRKSKTNYLIEVSRSIAKRVLQTQKAEALPPMSSYERRLVHTELASFKEVQTESIGQEPRRRVVVKPMAS